MLSHENKNYDCAGLMRHITKPDFYQYVFESLVNNIPAAKAALFYFYDKGKTSLNLEHAFGFE